MSPFVITDDRLLGRGSRLGDEVLLCRGVTDIGGVVALSSPAQVGPNCNHARICRRTRRNGSCNPALVLRTHYDSIMTAQVIGLTRSGPANPL